jgi:hypothetical protein
METPWLIATKENKRFVLVAVILYPIGSQRKEFVITATRTIYKGVEMTEREILEQLMRDRLIYEMGLRVGVQSEN